MVVQYLFQLVVALTHNIIDIREVFSIIVRE